METKQKRTKVVVSVLALAALCVLSVFAVAGNLEPSAPPAPTMKTLDEVEPRIPIAQDDIPLTITQSGSYYFTSDLTAAGTAITIECNDVTIDLMGYRLTGPGSGTNYGIYMDARSNVEIRNGTVRNFGGHGIYEASRYGRAHRIIRVRAMANGDYGISLLRYLEGYGHLVKDCTAAENVGYGILAGSGSTVTGNTAYNNQQTGIYAYQGCTVTGNTASYNGGSSGIVGGSGCTVTGNTVYANQGSGISCNDSSTVTGNTVYNNNRSGVATYGGIRVGGDCLVKGNTAWNNWQNNIYTYGSGGNTIEGNLVTDSTNGIRVASTDNLIIRNTARNNTTNYNIDAGNAYGQIKNVAGGGSFINSDPTANFVF